MTKQEIENIPADADGWRQLPGGGKIHETAILGDGTQIGVGVVIDRDVSIGPRAEIGDYVRVGWGSIICQGAQICSRAEIGEWSTIGDVLIGPGTQIGGGAVIGYIHHNG